MITQDELNKYLMENSQTASTAPATVQEARDSLQDVLKIKPASYAQSPSVQTAHQNYQTAQAQKPQSYQSAYSAQIDELLNKVLNRKAFTYDMNADPMYQQYKNNYVNLGLQAARDVTGAASALTGGYGNSYAATAGNQAYQNYLGQLNGIVPSLYAQAAQTYQNQGTDMYNNLSALQGQESSAYGKYRDQVGDYYNNLNAQYTAYSDAYNRDYQAYLDALNAWQQDRAYAYQQAQDMKAQQNYETEWAYNTRKKK